MATLGNHSNFIQTQDGVRLNYTQTGPTSGAEILFIPGWRQTAAQWRKQVEYFQVNHHVTTYDHRGHGESEKPESGYTVALLAQDLKDLIDVLDLNNLIVVGHSMGSSVVWAFWDTYTHLRPRFQRFVFADQSPCMLINPAWSQEDVKRYGAIFTQGQLDTLGEDFAAKMSGLMKAMYTSEVSQEDFAWASRQNEKTSDKIAIELLQDHASRDWRSVLPGINIPTLVIASAASVFASGQGAYIKSQIPGSQLVTFVKEDRGSHFMFWENPAKFNKTVERFLVGGTDFDRT
ncbi:Alpha/Beta hydrolase protein [Xylariales sp. AK1849]|nr:Alpha/Beta hydrolase protein [Xylariales sp. AK1849]